MASAGERASEGEPQWHQPNATMPGETATHRSQSAILCRYDWKYSHFFYLLFGFHATLNKSGARSSGTSLRNTGTPNYRRVPYTVSANNTCAHYNETCSKPEHNLKPAPIIAPGDPKWCMIVTPNATADLHEFHPLLP